MYILCCWVRYYSLMESLDRMANNTRTERLTIGAGTELLPWVTPGQVHTQSRLPTLFPFQRRLLRPPLFLSLSLSVLRLTRRSVTVALLSASCEQTPGTGGQPPLSANPHVGPGVAMRNALIQLFANGATGFNVYTADGFVDCDLWLAFRDVPPSVGKSTQSISIRNDWN